MFLPLGNRTPSQGRADDASAILDNPVRKEKMQSVMFANVLQPFYYPQPKVNSPRFL